MLNLKQYKFYTKTSDMPNNQNVTLVVRGGIFGTHNFGKSFSPKEKPFKFCQYFILDVNFENLTVELYICYVFNTPNFIQI